MGAWHAGCFVGLSNAAMKAAGRDGSTPRDLVASLTGRVKDTMSTLQRLILVLLWPSRPGDVVGFVQAILAAMFNSTYFTNPTPGQAVLQADLATFIKALGASQTKAEGTKEVRDEAEHALKSHVTQLMQFAQAAMDANLNQAALMAASSGFQTKKVAKRSKPDVELRWGLASGMVLMIVRSLGDHVTYFYAFSTDQKVWTNLPPSHYASATVSGLTPGVTHYFRFQTLVTGRGLSDWSQTYSILVK